jgi:hypothetical protein
MSTEKLTYRKAASRVCCQPDGIRKYTRSVEGERWLNRCCSAGVLGDEDDKQEIEAPEALAGTEAFAAAAEPP